MNYACHRVGSFPQYQCMTKILSKPMSCYFQWYEKFTDVDEVIPVSAKYGHGVDDVKDWILSKLPAGPAYYPKVLRIHLFIHDFQRHLSRK